MSLSDDGSAYGRRLNAIFDPRLNGKGTGFDLPPMPRSVQIGQWVALTLTGLILLWKAAARLGWLAGDFAAFPIRHSLELTILFWTLLLGQMWLNRRYRPPTKARR